MRERERRSGKRRLENDKRTKKRKKGKEKRGKKGKRKRRTPSVTQKFNAKT
jgi:hypothetical protein